MRYYVLCFFRDLFIVMNDMVEWIKAYHLPLPFFVSFTFFVSQYINL